MNVETLAEMMNGAVITKAIPMGQQFVADNSRVPLAHADAIENLCSHCGVPEAKQGIEAIRLVGGTDHPEIASLDLGKLIGRQGNLDAGFSAAVSGMAAQKSGPDGQGRG